MYRRFSRCLIIFVTLLGLTAVPAAAQVPIQDFIGVISQVRFDPPNWTQIAHDTAAQGGIDWVRLAIFWNYSPVAGDPYRYVANQTDIYHGSVAAWQRGMRVFAILNPPNNAADNGWLPPAIEPNVYQTYLKLAEDMAFNYGFAIESWEAGNEVNGTDAFWNSVYHSGPSYARLLRDLHAALRRGFQRRGDYAQLVATRGGEGFKLYAAGTAGTDLIWLEEVCAGLEETYRQYGDGPYIHGFSIHPYSSPNGPDVTTVFSQAGFPQHPISHGTFLQNVDWARAVLRRHPGVPQELYISEHGWSTLAGDPYGQSVTLESQAIYTAQSLVEGHASRNLSRTILGFLADSPSFPVYSFWGYVAPLFEDASKKPSFRAVETAVHKLSGLTLRQNLGYLLPNGRAYLYGGGGRQVLVFWHPTNQPLNIKLSTGASATLFDRYEGVVNTFPGLTTINPVATPGPRYLEVTGGTITEIGGVKLTAGGDLNLTGYSLAPTRWSRASTTVAGSSPSNAFDGNVANLWNSGGAAPAWIEVKLYDTQRVKALLLHPAMLPSGVVDHRIDLSINYGGYQEIDRVFAYVMEDMKVLVVLPQTYENVSSVRVRTVPVDASLPAAATWVAWKEIQIYQ